jgi:hypothetical protein
MSEFDVQDLKASIDATIEAISEKRRMHRKVQFLLDIRGLLVINKLRGDYVEFGVYRGEMMYAAGQIIGKNIDRFIGLDTFTGLPEPETDADALFVFEAPGFMASPLDVAGGMMADYDTLFIQGDFRSEDVLARFKNEVGRIAVLSVDCNWPSSVEAALLGSASALTSGSIIFIDDYFVGLRGPNFNDPLLRQVEEISGLRLREFKTYPPCARAFIAEAQP